MWVVHGNRMYQLIPTHNINVMQHQSLPVVYWANSSLEMAWADVVRKGTYSGYDIAPFYTNWLEGFDIHDEADFRNAEKIVASGMVNVPIWPLPDSDLREWDET
jgi:CMP-N-acetylneuraminic acid synthetase